MLQELVACKQMRFYDKNWRQIGTKNSLLSSLARITMVNRGVIEGSESISSISIGRRMYLVSRLSSDRPENIAYSLLGIFGVNMEIIYGEGHRAFIRLQVEILRDTDDATIFMWRARQPRFRGILQPTLPRNSPIFTTEEPSATFKIGGYLQINVCRNAHRWRMLARRQDSRPCRRWRCSHDSRIV